MPSIFTENKLMESLYEPLNILGVKKVPLVFFLSTIYLALESWLLRNKKSDFVSECYYKVLNIICDLSIIVSSMYLYLFFIVD